MEDWSKSIFETLDSFADMVDEFFVEFTEVVEELADEWQNTVGADIEKCLQDIVREFVDFDYFEFFEPEESIGETEQFFTHPDESILQLPSACVGCRHYHGHSYGGNLLVCGMHPYGWDTDNCPDWES
ncbi:hypothetical protein [Limnofasciculus baicalensis]